MFFFENYATCSIGAQGEEKVAGYLGLLNDSYYFKEKCSTYEKSWQNGDHDICFFM